MREYVSRRTQYRILTIVGIGLLLSSGGVAMLSLSSQPATGASVGELNISNASETVGPDGQLTGVTLTTNLSYSWESSHNLSGVTIELFVSNGGSYFPLDSKTISDPAKTGSGTATLGGDVTSTEAFQISDFDAAEGESTETPISVKAVLTVEKDGQRAATSMAEETAYVQVTRESLSVTAQISGDGSVQVITE